MLFFECALNRHFVDDFLLTTINRDSRRARSIQSQIESKTDFTDKFHFSKCAGFILVAFTIVFSQTNTRARMAIAKSIWENILSGWIFIGARVTKFAHKLQTTQIGRNFSCRMSREIIAWVPRERLPSRKNSARQSSLSKKVCSIYLAWTEARRWFIVEILLKWTLNSLVEIYDAFARVQLRGFTMASVKEGAGTLVRIHIRR